MPNWRFHVQLVSLFGVNSFRVSLEVSVTGQDNASPRYRIGGAVWCNEHERYECVKDRKQARGGGRCHQPAVTGLDRCRGQHHQRRDRRPRHRARTHTRLPARPPMHHHEGCQQDHRSGQEPDDRGGFPTGEFPCKVIRIGAGYRVVTVDLRRLLASS